MHPVPGPFAADLLDDWRVHGPAAIARVRTWMPQYYLRLANALATAPSRDDEIRALSEEELDTRLAKVLCELADSGAMPPGLRLFRTDNT